MNEKIKNNIDLSKIRGIEDYDRCVEVNTKTCKILNGLTFHSHCCNAVMWFVEFYRNSPSVIRSGHYNEYICSQCLQIAYINEYQKSTDIALQPQKTTLIQRIKNRLNNI